MQCNLLIYGLTTIDTLSASALILRSKADGSKVSAYCKPKNIVSTWEIFVIHYSLFFSLNSIFQFRIYFDQLAVRAIVRPGNLRSGLNNTSRNHHFSNNLCKLVS